MYKVRIRFTVARLFLSTRLVCALIVDIVAIVVSFDIVLNPNHSQSLTITIARRHDVALDARGWRRRMWAFESAPESVEAV